jgi:uncharacterized protein YidB (DUF937 family)
VGQAADIESRGSASVDRVTPQSVRRALDLGVTTAELHELFRTHSMTGVPQALEYLIDDVGRRYGTLRLGQASTYLRSDDPALIDQAIAQAASLGIDVRRLAPTVAISTTSLPDLMANLRAGGLVPAAEDGSGAVLDLRIQPSRVKQRSPQQHWREPPTASVDQLAALVDRMRSADRAVPAVPLGDAPIGDLLQQLRSAARDRQPTWIGYADAQGVSARRIVEPITVTPGKLVAFDRTRGEVRNFPLHRITSVALAEDSSAPAAATEPAEPTGGSV